MLPKLTEKRSVTFQAAELEPAFVTARRNALLDLRSVDKIRISRSGKGNEARYAVEVFTNASYDRVTNNTISTNSSGSNTEALTNRDVSSSQNPTLSNERELYEFVDLRNEVYNKMFLAHSRQYCKFCSVVLDTVVNGVDPGGVFFTLFGEDRAVRKLTTFTEDLLMRIAQNATETPRCCSAQILVPQVVHAFLFTPSTPTMDVAGCCDDTA